MILETITVKEAGKLVQEGAARFDSYGLDPTKLLYYDKQAYARIGRDNFYTPLYVRINGQ